MILLSIIIPTCYRNDFLNDCLCNLAPNVQKPQGFNYEVIVTDDSLNNEARQLIEQQFPWATWLNGPSTGPAANRNNGAKKAKGSWLIFLDDDCVPDTQLLNAYYNIIITKQPCDVLEGAIYSDDKIKLLYIAPINLTGGHLWSCNFCIKSSIFQKVKGFDENYKFPNLEDNDINKRLVGLQCVIIFVKDAKVYHPPRPVASPKKLAQRHESWFYYHAKFGDPQTMASLIKTIIRARMTAIFYASKNLTTIKAFFLIFSELYYTIKFSKKWRLNQISNTYAKTDY